MASFFIFSFLLLFASPLFPSVLPHEVRRPPAGASSPAAQAERLIRSFNLLPGEFSARGSGASAEEAPAGRLVEKRVRWPGLKDGDPTVEDLGHHAGYYTLPHTKAARMFYLFFESRTHNTEDPVVIWLTGGPGCSSELALFYENGPFKISDDLSLEWNDFGWDMASNIIYVDQPTGTGYSYTSDDEDIRHDENGVSRDLYDFLQEFFKEHPEYTQNNFYITGESYAGHYIPALASTIHEKNKACQGIHINLKGFAIGNGLTNPEIQYKAYTDYALDMKLIKKVDYDQINRIYPACQLSIRNCGTNGTNSCLRAYSICNSIFSSIRRKIGDTNYYDIRKQCEGSLCYDFSNMERFLNESSVKEALGVGDIEFVSCSTTVYQAMMMDWMRNLEVGIPALLEDGINLLVYAGEYDLICNWLGNSRWVHSMEWSGKQEFVSSPEVPLSVDGEEFGILKIYGPLSFLKVHDAGHMVPMDQPKGALEMLKRWTNGGLAPSSSEMGMHTVM